MAGGVRFESPDELLASVRRCATDVGKTPAATDYHDWQRTKPHEANPRLIRKWLGSWGRAVEQLDRAES